MIAVFSVLAFAQTIYKKEPINKLTMRTTIYWYFGTYSLVNLDTPTQSSPLDCPPQLINIHLFSSFYSIGAIMNNKTPQDGHKSS